MKSLIIFICLGISYVFSQEYEELTEYEISLIQSNQKEMMRVLQKTHHQDSLILKRKSKSLNPKDPNTKLLAERMLLSVKDPLNGGVGIAAPQVGINRRMFLFQRFDKVGNPFELAINPEIIWASELLQLGTEGDLSFDENGLVFRNYIIQVKYYDIKGELITENLEGFTAVIFQHERDHLNGILLIDRVKEQKRQNYKSIGQNTNLYQLLK